MGKTIVTVQDAGHAVLYRLEVCSVSGHSHSGTDSELGPNLLSSCARIRGEGEGGPSYPNSQASDQ